MCDRSPDFIGMPGVGALTLIRGMRKGLASLLLSILDDGDPRGVGAACGRNSSGSIRVMGLGGVYLDEWDKGSILILGSISNDLCNRPRTM